MADPDFEAAKAELAAALDKRLTVTSLVDHQPRPFTDLLAYVDEHVAVNIPAKLQVTSLIDGGTRPLNDALGFVDLHVGKFIPDRLAAIEAKLGAPVAARVGEPTQVVHPWRATLRTVVQTVPAIAAAIPAIVAAVEQDSPGLLGAAGVGALTVAGIVTRVMAIPAVNDLLTRWGLGAEPKGNVR